MTTIQKKGRFYTASLVVGALGIVFGDIGTSPLYALRECFHGTHRIEPSPANILGVLSLILWSLILIVSIKYLTFIMRADNKGEGGILALLALAVPDRMNRKMRRSHAYLLLLGVFGAALLYGDGMITPSISVLSAVEGLEVATPLFKPYIVPLTIIVLVTLFAFQKAGTGKVGAIFGPVTFLWFLTIAALGIVNIVRNPVVLSSIDPRHGYAFFHANGYHGFVVLGSVFLVVTGAEALYADMGHFGKTPIRLAWFFIVLPSLLLNYWGQGALLLSKPEFAENPFYRMSPSWSLYPLVILATTAAVIASQALISGAFSLTMQAIQLGYAPRLEIDHTSAVERGQIYLPRVNWFLMFSCIGLVIGFKSSSNLAAAYGIAVTLTMLITTILFYFAAKRLWNWNKYLVLIECFIFFAVELAFFGANALKIAHGGWFPLVVGALVFTLMSTWKNGRKILGERLRATSLPLKLFLDEIKRSSPTRVKGTAVFMSSNSEGTPMALLHNLKHNKVLHERVVILTITTADVPHIDKSHRVRVEELGQNFFKVVGQFGFMEEPNVPDVLASCEKLNLSFKESETTFFLSRENIIATPRPGMMLWREKLFSIMSRNAQHATTFFRLPANRVVELGMQVEI